MKKHKEKGFTLVELMIVVAIIAILAVIAIPMYTGYVKKAKITEALTGIDAIKSAEVVYYQKNGEFFETDENNPISKLGVVLDQTKWTYSVTTGSDSNGNPTITITATATDEAGSNLSGGTVSITGTVDKDNGSISWSNPTGDGDIIKDSDLP